MDSIAFTHLANLATQVTNTISPALSIIYAGGQLAKNKSEDMILEECIKILGNETGRIAKTLFCKISPKMSESLEKALINVSKNSEDPKAKEELQKKILKLLAEDPNFAKEIENIIIFNVEHIGGIGVRGDTINIYIQSPPRDRTKIVNLLHPGENVAIFQKETTNTEKAITWLHVSDTLFGHPKYGWDLKDKFVESSVILTKFYEDLEKMKKDHDLCPDFIFYTGDIIFGDEGNFEIHFQEASNFTEQIRNLFKIQKENVFIVPGNHDINRVQHMRELAEYFEKYNDDPRPDHIISQDLKEKKGELREKCIERFKEYKEFLKISGFTHLLEDPEMLIYSQIKEINGFKIGIAGLNSAWSSLKGDEKGKLWLGSYQIDDALKKLNEVEFKISLIHHPLDWLNQHEAKWAQTKIEEFDFFLHGHEGYPPMIIKKPKKKPKHIEIIAGTYYDYPNREDYYNFVKHYPSKGCTNIFLRRFDKDQGFWVASPINKKQKR